MLAEHIQNLDRELRLLMLYWRDEYWTVVIALALVSILFYETLRFFRD